MKKSTITPEMIMEATISYVANYGLEKVTTKKVADTIHISEGSVFNYFPNKRALLVNCLSYIDNQIDAILKGVPSHGLNLKKHAKAMWYSYFEFLASHRDYTKFYLQFRQSSYYDRETIAEQNNSYNFFMKVIQKNIHLIGINPDFFWTYLIESTMSFALHVADGGLPNTQKDVDRIYNLMAYGFMGPIKKEKDD